MSGDTKLLFDPPPSAPLSERPKLKIDAPRCTSCGGETRLIGLEPHPDKLLTDVLTFQCQLCPAYEVAEVPGGQYAGPEIIVVT